MQLFVPPLGPSSLVPEKRSGHVAVFYKGLLVVIGGYYKDPDELADWGEEYEDYFPYDIIWFYDPTTHVWRQRNASGDVPPVTVGACACVVEDLLYLLCGFRQEEAYTNEVYQLDMASLTWRQVPQQQTDNHDYLPPSPRDKFGCWVWKNRIFVFGGFGDVPWQYPDSFETDDLGGMIGWNNELHCLDCNSVGGGNSGDMVEPWWSLCKPTGTLPTPRAAFAATQIAHHAYVFGGRFRDGRRNDMFRLDLDNLVWEEIIMEKPIPRGRSWHTMTALSERHLFVYGGMDTSSHTLHDVWVYDVGANSWKEIANGAQLLGEHRRRVWHTACSTDTPGELVVFGGSSCRKFGESSQEPECQTNEVAFFRFSAFPLKRLCTEKLASIAS